MSITLLELSNKLNAFANDLTGQEQANLMQLLALDSLAMIKKRVQETGVDANGSKYAPYSTKSMLASRKGMTQSAYDKIASSKDKRRELKWVTINGHKLFEVSGGYKQYRDLHGRQTGFVDFVFTGRLFGNIKTGEPGDVKLVSSQSELASGIAVIKATQELEKKKLSGLTERKGEILALSKVEEQKLTVNYEKWLIKVLKKNGIK
jgi:hypothetical protein